MYQAVCVNRGTKAGVGGGEGGGGVNVGHSLSPPSHFMFVTQDEATRTCAWDANLFIAKKNICLYYFHCNDRGFKPAVLRELIETRQQLSS